MALLGEMHFAPSAPDSWFALPREGGVAYAAQEAWVQNETIRVSVLGCALTWGGTNVMCGRKISCLVRSMMRNGTTRVRLNMELSDRHALMGCSVISQCALSRDLTLFDAGDMTEGKYNDLHNVRRQLILVYVCIVGEKGMTLSGGQKVYINFRLAGIGR